VIGTVHHPNLLAQAAEGRGILLSRREFRAFEKMSVAQLRDSLRDLGRHSDRCRGKGSAEIFGAEGSADLGDAPAWIDAGAVYEELLEFMKLNGPPDYVICVDPWAAQLRSRVGELASSAKWILVSDLAQRARAGKKEYWEELGAWFETLAYSAILPKESWDPVLAPAEHPVPRPGDDRIFAEKLGAWRWRRLVPVETSTALLFLVRYSGSLSHLRVLLDSLLRQEGPRETSQCVILAGAEGEDPQSYLRWVALAHPRLRLTLLRTSADWKPELGRLLEKAPTATLVMIGDHAILPTGFARLVQAGTQAKVLGIPMSLEATGHIVTGNLDPHPNYETLIRSFSAEQKPRTECARIIPPEALKGAGGDLVGRLLQLSEEAGRQQSGPPISLLEMADLP